MTYNFPFHNIVFLKSKAVNIKQKDSE